MTPILTQEERMKRDGQKDEELLAASVRDPKLFEIIVDRYQAAFQRKAETFARTAEDAEDIVQETFVKIYLHAGSFAVQEGATFKSWGYKILVNTALSHYRKHKRKNKETVELTDEMQEIIADPTSVFSGETALSDYISSILVRMPESLSKVLELYFLRGMPQKEIARALDTSVGAVKARMFRAKQEFKKISATLEN